MLRRTIRGCVVIFVVILALGGCVTTTTLGPTVTITFIKTPVERSNEAIYEFCKILIANPGEESYRVYWEWIELNSQGEVVWSGVWGDEYLYPGYREELPLNALFPPDDYEAGLYTLVIRLITPGPDGVPGTNDDVVLAEDRENFELR